MNNERREIGGEGRGGGGNGERREGRGEGIRDGERGG